LAEREDRPRRDHGINRAASAWFRGRDAGKVQNFKSADLDQVIRAGMA
jgi:hypothetical protein